MPDSRALRRTLAALTAACALLLSGCAMQTRVLLGAPPSGLPPVVELSDTPWFVQEAYQCGPASLAMTLSAAGLPTTPQDVIGRVFVPAREGSLQIEMLAAARARGAVATLLPDRLDALLAELAAGHPVVVLQNLGLALRPVWHYAVAIGYDLPSGDLLLRSGPERRQRMPLSTFEHTWDRGGRWAFVALPPGVLPASATQASVTDALVAFERVASPDAARRGYAAALSRWPASLVLAMGVGNSAHAAGDRPGAAAAFRDAAERHRDAAALHNLAVVLDELGDRAGALAAARAAAAIDGPWREAARRTLGRLEAQGAGHPVESRPSR